jgi:hypothetical protein
MSTDRHSVAEKPGGRSARIPGVESYKSEPLYPKIARAAAVLLQRGKVVAPGGTGGDGLADPQTTRGLANGQGALSGRVIAGNLTRLSRLLRVLRLHAHDLKLVPSVTAYMRWGKGPKQRLRFTKSGEPKIEEAYSRHFVWPGKGPFHPPAPRGTAQDDSMLCKERDD